MANPNQNGANNFGRTKGGFTPSFNGEYPFSVTVREIEEFLNNLVFTVIRENNKNTNPNADNYIPTPALNASCNLVPITNISKVITPLMMIIPAEWTMAPQQTMGGKELPQFWENREEEDEAITILYPPIMRVLAKFLYSKADKELFRSSSWRSSMELSDSAARLIMSFRVPRKQKFSSKNSTRAISTILVTIDPARLLSECVSSADTNDQYVIEDLRFTKNSNKSGVYKFKRRNKSKKNNRVSGGEVVNYLKQHIMNGSYQNNSRKRKH